MKSNTSVHNVLQWGIEKLKKAGVETPVLDAEVLLTHALSPSPVLTDILSQRERKEVRGRAWLYAHSEQHVSTSAVQHFTKLLRRRVKREPVAYIVGHKEFYGIGFYRGQACACAAAGDGNVG